MDTKSTSFGTKSSDVPYGQLPFYTGPIIGGGVVFVPTMEHSPTVPLYREKPSTLSTKIPENFSGT